MSTDLDARNRANAEKARDRMLAEDWQPIYEKWRHGGWYVVNICYSTGAVGCVSRNYADRKWRIACDLQHHRTTYPNRDAAAYAERDLARKSWA